MASVELTGFCVLDRDSQRAKFSFTVQRYSKLVHNKGSKVFHFAGHYWKLQVTKKDGHFGMFLRWYGTKHGHEGGVRHECEATLVFAVLNKLNPDESVSEGQRKEKDVFQSVGGGIGYSKIITVEELERGAGFLIGDAVHVHVALKIVSTTFHDTLPVTRSPSKDFVTGEKFPFFGTSWYLILFPDGEKPEVALDVGERRKACLYLMREMMDDHLLRHSVQFTITVDGGNGLAVDQHFYNTDSNVYGTASFMPVSQMQKIAKQGQVQVSVRFNHIVPYFYFAYPTRKDEQSFGQGFYFKDHYGLPWYFELLKSQGSRRVQGKIVLDPSGDAEAVQRLVKRKSCLQMSWLVELLSPSDADKSILFSRRGRRPLQEAVLSNSGESDHVDFPITCEELFSSGPVYMDDEGCLCVRLSLVCSNFVVESRQPLLTIEEVVQIYDQLRKKYANADRDTIREQLEDELYTKLLANETNEDEEIRKPARRDESDEKKEREERQTQTAIETQSQSHANDQKIKDLTKLVEQYEQLLSDRKHSNDEVTRRQKYEETHSLQALIELSRPTDASLKSLHRLSKSVQQAVEETPLKIIDVLLTGSLGQDTAVANRLELDFIVFLTNMDHNRVKHKVMLSVIEEKIKERSSDKKIDTLAKFSLATTSNGLLPYSSGFFKTSKALICKLGDVKVSILLSMDWNQYGGYSTMYQLASTAPERQLHRFITAASERQVQFVQKQPKSCKILITAVKAWSDSVDWRDTGNRPSSYLLALLVAQAYALQKRRVISTSISFGRQVLHELAILVQDTKLRVEWPDFYNPSDYPINEGTFTLPFVRDPALPAHNVAKTGLSQWEQFREEISVWVDSLTD